MAAWHVCMQPRAPQEPRREACRWRPHLAAVRFSRNSAPLHHIDMMQVARPARFELPHTRSTRCHHTLRVAPVGCSMDGSAPGGRTDAGLRYSCTEESSLKLYGEASTSRSPDSRRHNVNVARPQGCSFMVDRFILPRGVRTHLRHVVGSNGMDVRSSVRRIPGSSHMSSCVCVNNKAAAACEADC